MNVDPIAKTMTPYHALWYYILKDAGADVSKIGECWNFWDTNTGLFSFSENIDSIMRSITYGSLEPIEALKETFDSIDEFNDINLPLRASNLRVNLDAPLDWSLEIINKFNGDKSISVLDMFLCYFEDISDYREIVKSDVFGSRITCANNFLNYGIENISFVRNVIENTIYTKSNQDPSWSAVNLHKRYGKSAPVNWACSIIRNDNIGSPFEASLCLFQMGLIEEDFVFEVYEKEKLVSSPNRKDYVINQFKKQILER